MTTIKTIIAQRVLYPYQQSAVQWMMERENDTEACGGLLCDEMGLGKSLTMLGLVANRRVERTLLIAPIAVLHQWKQLCIEHGFITHTVEKKDWVKTTGDWRKGHIFIVNYNKLKKTYAHLFEKPFQRVICDEAHCLRNSSGIAYTFLKGLVIPRKWFLTGTPIVNRLEDLHSLARLLKARTHSTLSPQEAEAFMETYALSRTRNQIQSQGVESGVMNFPSDPEEITHTLEFESQAEALFYRGIQGILAQEFEDLMAQQHIHMEEVLTLILRLRQISVHPQVYIQSKRRTNPAYARPNWTSSSTKASAICNILKSETKSHRYVIFCNFLDEMRILQEMLKQEPTVGQVLLYDGSLSQEQRIDVINKSKEPLFQPDSEEILHKALPKHPWLSYDVYRYINNCIGPKHTILLAQIQSAGTGLNLQHMDRVIFTSLWWTAALMDQAMARVVRVGQTNPVKVHKLVLAEEEEMSLNIDAYMATLVSTKRELCLQMLEAANHSTTFTPL